MRAVAVLIGVLSIPAAAVAQQDGGVSKPVVVTGKLSEKASNDPNRQICRTHTAIGSRLTQVRVCRTRQEWATVNQFDRQEVEKIQALSRFSD